MHLGWALTSEAFIYLWHEHGGGKPPQQVFYIRTEDTILGCEILEIHSTRLELRMVESWKFTAGQWERVPHADCVFSFNGDDDPSSFDLQLLQKLDWGKTKERLRRTRCATEGAELALHDWLNPARALKRKQAEAEQVQKQDAQADGICTEGFQSVLVVKDEIPLPAPSEKLMRQIPSQTAQQMAQNVGKIKKEDRRHKVEKRKDRKAIQRKKQEEKITPYIEVDGEKVPVECQGEIGGVYQGRMTRRRRKKLAVSNAEKPKGFRPHHNTPSLKFQYPEKPVKKSAKPEVKSPTVSLSPGEQVLAKETEEVAKLCETLRRRMSKAMGRGHNDRARKLGLELSFWRKRLETLSTVKFLPSSREVYPPVVFFAEDATGAVMLGGISVDALYELQDALQEDKPQVRIA